MPPPACWLWRWRSDLRTRNSWPQYTYGASLSGWLLLGNRPVFADIEADTLLLDPGSVRTQITPRTRAILAVDIFGVPSDSAALRRIADEHGLWYVAHAAQSLGA